jgi:hypothetical protein
MARDVELRGHHYSVTKIDDVFEQTYLASRFAPLLSSISDAGIGGIFDAIGKLDKEVLKEIYFPLLGCVKRRTGKTWSSIVENNRFMYQDINMLDAFSLAKEAFMENYEGFFGEAASLLTENQSAE